MSHYEWSHRLSDLRKEDLQDGLATHGAKIMGDIPNFTDVQPKIQISDIVSKF